MALQNVNTAASDAAEILAPAASGQAYTASAIWPCDRRGTVLSAAFARADGAQCGLCGQSQAIHHGRNPVDDGLPHRPALREAGAAVRPLSRPVT